MDNLQDILNEYCDHYNLYNFEGESGVKKLERLIIHLGYLGDAFSYGSPIERFLADNSGAIEAIIEWIGEQCIEDWKDNLEAQLPEINEEE